eukprot:CAMPEP_0202966818 /NCGR_PEP_ID=MMETSP1396-20130829/11388_1 /ASSEMBLY_ACC=CAM_ASM_000872 /TAXON_ID= /ORGANISM="Pseudokeronopsis sp., Strain Brazil" /LENGTH=56 /DNA_ID=CAMNT_0049691107 /DNA_START=1480 /DNA_END=1650 /DNA_ORIENTATION=-
MADLLRVHDYNYVKKLMDLNEQLKSLPGGAKIRYDKDTAFSSETWEAALLASGGGI